jgi:hypothetical protein
MPTSTNKAPQNQVAKQTRPGPGLGFTTRKHTTSSPRRPFGTFFTRFTFFTFFTLRTFRTLRPVLAVSTSRTRRALWTASGGTAATQPRRRSPHLIQPKTKHPSQSHP